MLGCYRLLLHGSAVAHSQARDQLIQLMGRKQPQATTGIAPITSEINNRTEMGIGVVMPPNGLLRCADHRPAALDVQLHLPQVKPQSRDVGLGLLSNSSHQGRKQRLPVELPNAIDVASPGATRFGIALGLAPQLNHLLHPLGQLQRIKLQLNPGQSQMEQGLKVHAGAGQAESNHKKTGPEGPVSA